MTSLFTNLFFIVDILDDQDFSENLQPVDFLSLTFERNKI